MTFLYPSLLWILLPLGLLLWKSSKQISINKVTITIHLTMLMLLVFALARPVEKEALQEASIEAKDIIIALDVSYSMQATDLSPTRYDFAKATIRVLLEENPSDNIMLIAFTSNPLLLSPPTTDHRLIDVALQSLNPEYILTKGTSLQALFKKLSSMNIANKNLILLSDGGEKQEIAQKLEALSITLLETAAFVHIVALGTTQGTTLMDKEGVSLKDAQGNLVVSRINPLLSQLAQRVNGTYMAAGSTPQATAKTLDKHIRDTHSKAQYIQKMQYRYNEWYDVPLALALLLFLLLHTRGIKFLLLLFALLGLPLQASFFDLYHLQQAYKSYENKTYTLVEKNLKQIHTPSLQSRILLANTYYKQADYKQAILIYSSIRTTSALQKQMLYYNIATTYAHMEAYDKAKIYYTKALQLQPDDDAQFNLGLIALKHDKKESSLGIAHPKSQSSDSSKSDVQEKKKENEREEDQPSSGSGSGSNESGERSSKEDQKKSKLRSDDSQDDAPHPLGSKMYELINKGYIRETQPW